MSYAVKELFATLQGAGANAGRAAVFCRFAVCNLWSGLERDRADAVCRFCDTDFVGIDGTDGGRFADADALARAARALWDAECGPGPGFIVCTGGEPLLQLDAPLIEAFHEAGLEVAVETNGTIAAPAGIDWICVSPKAGAPLKQTSGNELKLVYPKDGAAPEAFAELSFDNFYLQPLDGPYGAANAQAAIRYCLAHPAWRLSVQTHKFLGMR